ncbi:MAG TPA: NTP transferase domain-containing protein [Sphingomicrobium sp.]|nr:NTP transferase domain-containing protein [Sphingomicrobium sp.]
MTKVTALVLAGSRPEGDPFATAFGAPTKALIPIAGEPMVRRPVRALLASPQVAEVVVLAQEPELLADALPADPRLSVRRSLGTIADTLSAVCNDPGTPFPVLVTTADHALLTPAMVAEFVGNAKGADIAVAFVESTGLLGRFPDAQRTWLAFGGGRYSGANLFLLGSPGATRAIDQWRSVESDRKKGLRVLAALGPTLFMGAVLKMRTLHQTAEGLSRKLGITVRAVEMSDPLAAVDVDKPSDHALVEAILQRLA